jgi:hypothetical protein
VIVFGARLMVRFLSGPARDNALGLSNTCAAGLQLGTDSCPIARYEFLGKHAQLRTCGSPMAARACLHHANNPCIHQYAFTHPHLGPKQHRGPLQLPAAACADAGTPPT